MGPRPAPLALMRQLRCPLLHTSRPPHTCCPAPSPAASSSRHSLQCQHGAVSLGSPPPVQRPPPPAVWAAACRRCEIGPATAQRLPLGWAPTPGQTFAMSHSKLCRSRVAKLQPLSASYGITSPRSGCVMAQFEWTYSPVVVGSGTYRRALLQVHCPVPRLHVVGSSCGRVIATYTPPGPEW